MVRPMKNEYNKCPLCGGDSFVLGEFGYVDKGKYVRLRECIKCKVMFKNIYRLEYHGREIIPPLKEGGESDDN
jgi:hypothetical protein